MADRLRINWAPIHALLESEEVADIVKEHTRRIDQACDSESRVDFAQTGERARGAVIAGYETGATAESTREALLRAVHRG